MTIRIGDLLVQSGVITPDQADQILSQQQQSGEPFGLIAEQLFQVDPDLIEQAWATQYAQWTRVIDPTVEVFESTALELVSRRQAWQFQVLPIRFDERELMMATTQSSLRRALRFATNVIGVPIYLVLADEEPLGEMLCTHYPMRGMSSASLGTGALDDLMQKVRAAC